MTQPETPQTFSDILVRRTSRRSVLRAGGMAAAAAVGARLMLNPTSVLAKTKPLDLSSSLSSLTFREIAKGLDDRHHLAEGYSAQLLLRWGDKVIAGAPDFDPSHPSAAAQEKQFGYNNDFIAYFPLNPLEPSAHGLLCINHEYTIAELAYPGGKKPEDLTLEEHRSEMAAHGASIVEIRQEGREWQTVTGNYNRRITATTPMKITGPAAGDARMKTTADPTGMAVLGMFANCAGGTTPWSTYLTCEENFDGYFPLNDYDGTERANHDKMTIGQKLFHRWDIVDSRFDVTKEPNEPNRFGWVVEIDPFDPSGTPIKRTALGRIKHESATCILNHDKRVAVYMGDDESFQCIYRFVTTDPYDPGRKAHNRSLLDHGVLSVAKFDEDGLTWLPLVFGQGPLTEENNFKSQADVLIETRRAADLLSATKMDRPEDIEVSPVTGRVYVSLTKNLIRTDTDIVNRRWPDPMGYIVELSPPGTDGARDHTIAQYGWDIFLEGGNPDGVGAFKGSYGGKVTPQGQLACPDNLAFDPKGRLWITTDGQEMAIGQADMIYATDCLGPGRAIPRAFFRGPKGCEMTGPCFTPDGKTLFVSVQHPGGGSTYDSPSTRWPDFDEKLPPRPTVLAITKDDGGVLGS